jgi:hypothetical protein
MNRFFKRIFGVESIIRGIKDRVKKALISLIQLKIAELITSKNGFLDKILSKIAPIVKRIPEPIQSELMGVLTQEITEFSINIDKKVDDIEKKIVEDINTTIDKI